MDWLGLLAVQGTLKSLLQHHSSKASILQHSAFIVQLSHPYMTTGETIALTRWTSVGKVMFLLFNMLSRLVIAFLPRSKRLLISWLQSPSAVILEAPKIKSVTVSIVVCKSHLSAGPSQHLARILGAGTCSACLPWVSQKTRANRRLKGKQSKWGDHTHDELITVWLHFLEKEGNCHVQWNFYRNWRLPETLTLSWKWKC